MVLHILRSRKFARRVLIGLSCIIIPAFLFWGVNVNTGSDVIGTISGRAISAGDLEDSRQGIKVQLFFYDPNYAGSMRELLQNQSVMNMMAWERLILLTEAEQRGINPPDNTILGFIASHPLFHRNGSFDREVYDYVLRSSFQMDPRRFEELVRENIKVRSLRQDILKDVSVTDEEIMARFKALNDKAIISYVFIGDDLFTKDVSVSDQEARTYYEGTSASYMEPARINVEYIAASYDNTGARTEALGTMSTLYGNIAKDPSSMADMAGQNGLKHGTTGAFSENDVIPGIPFSPEFYKTAFSLSPGEVSPPVATGDVKGNVYILRKMAEYPARVKPFETVEDLVKTRLAEEKKMKLAEQKAGEYFAGLSTGTNDLDAIAAALGTTVERTGPIGTTDYIENVGPAKDLMLRVLEGQAGAFVPPVRTQKGYLLARIDEILPAGTEKFEKDKNTIRTELLSNKQIAAMDTWLKQQTDKVKVKKPIGTL
ncbi:MAG: peptidyl-prolyl cis-trans isomerase [Candidatus Omnitrophica bacterium]|nr:peptidyl-prolyl cis-trans isomerase [Candidatus Omnitrophota bacterium]MDD5488185.1 peptidyl-prolyl cis-trans isomerase [Candidatus Omnitrophota bacterium]